MMRKVTALKSQKNRRRVNVYLDGEFAFGLARILAEGLQIGQEIDEDRAVELVVADAQEVAYLRAIHFLGYRTRSEAEVRKHLKKHDIPSEIITAVLERLRRARLVDDRKFAESWVANRSEFRPRGRRALRHELLTKKVPLDIIDATLSTIDEEELAYQAARIKDRKMHNLEWREYYRKMSGYLSRRGFTSETALPIIRRVWEERGT